MSQSEQLDGVHESERLTGDSVCSTPGSVLSSAPSSEYPSSLVIRSGALSPEPVLFSSSLVESLVLDDSSPNLADISNLS